MSDKPWWLDWRRLPPFMEHGAERRRKPFSSRQIWIVRLGWPMCVLAAIVVGVRSGLWSPLATAPIFFTMGWSGFTPAQRRQVLGRRHT